MDFSDALRAIKRGKVLVRTGWARGGLRVFLTQPPEQAVKEDHPMASRVPVGTMIGSTRYIAGLNKDGTVTPWLASQWDLLADDWMIDDGGVEESFIRGGNGG